LTEENSRKLTERFGMFQNLNVDPRYPFPMFGFECGDGWFDIIWRLAEDLEKIEKKELAETPIDRQAKQSLQNGYPWRLRVHQVKEKFGTLRFYVDSATDEIFERIHQAETESETICELCGKSGRLRSGGWVRTLCDKCEEERKKKKNG
jgi:hypothetical protein